MPPGQDDVLFKIGEPYQPGVGVTTPLESWSMGKSVTATMLGVLIHQGAYQLDQPAPVPEWRGDNDPRKKIRISDLMHMSSGLRIKAPDDLDCDPNGTCPDHLYFYTGNLNAFSYAATRPQQWMTSCRPAMGRAWETSTFKTAYGTQNASCPRDSSNSSALWHPG